MSYNLEIDQKEQYLHGTVTGENTLANVLSYFEEVYGACILYHCSNVLIEQRLIGPCLDTFDIFVVVTKNFNRAKNIGLRLAFIDVNIEHNTQALKFGENLSHMRGVNMRVFFPNNTQEMIPWLLGKD